MTEEQKHDHIKEIAEDYVSKSWNTFLDWGMQGARFCAKVQISEWCEVHTFDKE